jgi:hypothetical protein
MPDSDIPAGVPMQKSTPEVPEAASGAPEQMNIAAEEAATATGGEEVTTVGHTPRVLMQGRKNSRRRTPGRIPLYSY